MAATMASGSGSARVGARLLAVARSSAARAWKGAWDPRVLRELAPLVLVVAMSPWLKMAFANYVRAALFRDADMFTFASWCVLHGDRLYDQVATPDGPLVYLVYGALNLAVRSTSDQAFHVADLVFQLVTGGLMAALLVPADTEHRWLRRITWGLTGGAAWFVATGWGFTGALQREGYYAALGSLGICLVYASCHYGARTARWLLLGGCFLASWMMFGKHTGIIYAALAVMTALLLPEDPVRRMGWRLRWAGAGVTLAVASALVFVAAVGSLRGFYFWYLRYPFEVYRFFEPVPASDLLSHEDREMFYTPAFTALVGGVAAVATGSLPPRALAFAVGPVLHVAAAVLQRKGWGYQFVPIGGSSCLAFGAALVAAWTNPDGGRGWSPVRTAAAVALLVILGRSLLEDVQASYWLKEVERHVDDHDVVAPREAAKYLRAHTGPDDRIYYYGNDPVVEFAAQRHPAAPCAIVLMLRYSFALDAKGELSPTAAQRARIAQMQSDVQADTCRRVLSEKPAAMVFTDHASPGGNDGVADVEAFCPGVKPLLEQDYRQGRDADGIHVFLRNDHP